MAALSGPRGRRAAVRGRAAIAVTSAAVNQGLKALHRRSRPDRGQWTARRHVPMPGSSSFPSGHSASGVAFASAVSVEYPLLALPLRGLAAAVAYSRVHTGVHDPGDAVAGAPVGAATGQTVARTLDWRDRRRLGASGGPSVG
jgi:membrane-associated phospholipid phosphatase